MYATMTIERGGVTTNTMVCLFSLGYLLLVAPDTKRLLDENRVFEENMNIGKSFRNRRVGEQGIVINWKTRRKDQIRNLNGGG